MHTHPALAIGLDLGATKIEGALVTRQGKILAHTRLDITASPGTPTAPESVIPRLVELIQMLRGKTSASIAGIGIGSPGRVDAQHGIIHKAVNLGWQEVPLAQTLYSTLAEPLPIWVDNDTNVQALGEAYFGAGQGADPFVYVGIGTGLGSGIVIGGKLLDGANQVAAEMGHLVLDTRGRRCACGLRGCVETVVSGPGMIATAHELAAAGRVESTVEGADGDIAHNTSRTQLHLPTLTTAQLLAAADSGDSLAAAVIEKTGSWLGKVFAVLAVTVNPACIAVGGGVGKAAYRLLLPPAQRELHRRALADSIVNLSITPSQVESTAIGAASLVWQARTDE